MEFQEEIVRFISGQIGGVRSWRKAPERSFMQMDSIRINMGMM